jgi:SAM-dependent methyltransferase
MNEVFFYMKEDPYDYDQYAHLTDRSFKVIHKHAVSFLALWLDRYGSNENHKHLIVDVGSGTGAELFHILDMLPNYRVLCIDASRTMLDAMSRKVNARFGDATAGGRYFAAQRDFRTRGWLHSAIKETLGPNSKNECSAILSVYALHHLSNNQKCHVYEEISECLRPGHPFVNADLFSFEEDWMSSYVQSQEEDWIQSQFTELLNAHDLGSSEYKKLNRLRSSWLYHIKNENKLLPVTTSVDGEMNSEYKLLELAGLRHREMLYRLYQTAIIWSLKCTGEFT